MEMERMFDRKYFETFVTEHAGKFAEQHRVPSPRIDVVLRDTTNFWVNSIVALSDGYGTFRQIMTDTNVVDWTVPYEEITRVTFSTVSGTTVGFQKPTR
jgi:hypothetical protein